MPESHLDSEAILSNARALGPAIESVADSIARYRRLPDDRIEAMQRAGIFRVAFPRTWGGPERTILQQCELMESLAYHDASAAPSPATSSASGGRSRRPDSFSAAKTCRRSSERRSWARFAELDAQRFEQEVLPWVFRTASTISRSRRGT
ncbi:MAG: hypothetical protein FJ144_08620 [Deltaproteobacteria bacterium]|nr:hypothetical protein [Deltaproteobacteria bacterium]